MESIVATVLYLAVIGFLVYMVLKYVKMLEPFRDVIVAFVAFALVAWAAAVLFGKADLPTLPSFRR